MKEASNTARSGQIRPIDGVMAQALSQAGIRRQPPSQRPSFEAARAADDKLKEKKVKRVPDWQQTVAGLHEAVRQWNADHEKELSKCIRTGHLQLLNRVYHLYFHLYHKEGALLPEKDGFRTSLRSLATQCQCNNDTVSRHISRLYEAGLLGNTVTSKFEMFDLKINLKFVLFKDSESG